ncbi:MAG: hypothetical protein ABEK50_09915 [bacterium]
MKLSETLGKVRDLSSLNDEVRERIDDVIESVLDFVKLDSGDEPRKQPILKEPLFRETIEEWCHRNPESPARLVSIRPWSESDFDTEAFDFGNASKREILQVVRDQFGESVIMTQLDSDVFVLFLTEENGKYVANEFDWMNKLQGLKTRLSSSIPLSFYLESSKWPRDASTASSFLDRSTPAETYVAAFPFPTSAEQLEDALESVLEVDLRQQVEDTLPESVRDKVPLSRFLN